MSGYAQCGCFFLAFIFYRYRRIRSGEASRETPGGTFGAPLVPTNPSLGDDQHAGCYPVPTRTAPGDLPEDPAPSPAPAPLRKWMV